MKTYVLTLSATFPLRHPRAGEPTEFREKLTNRTKIHTIRANFDLWQHRFDEIKKGRAALSIRQWTGAPYKSKQTEICTLSAESGIGIQKLELYPIVTDYHNHTQRLVTVGDHTPKIREVAENDGLTFQDWTDWFKDYDQHAPMAIIHFTKFRY